MEKITRILKNHFVFILIITLALFIRIYRIDVLTTFGRDQGIDFLTVKDIIQNHHFTLIGIKTSLADFFQGPIYLYMLVPLFYLFNLNPIAGAYTAIIMSAITIFSLYFVTFKIFGIKTANLATLFFTVSPPLVIFGNTPLYQNFVPLFIILCIYCVFLLQNGYKKNVLLGFFTGFFAGIGSELHFLVATYVVALLIYFLLFIKKKVIIIPSYIVGLIVGISPTLAFELRHDFLNTRLAINYLNNSTNGGLNFLQAATIWAKRLVYFSSIDNNFLVILPLILGLYIIFLKSKLPKNLEILKKIALVVFITIVIFSLKLSSFGTHFFLPFWIILIILIPAYISNKKNKIMLSLAIFFILFNFIVSIGSLGANHGYFMPNGWNLKKIKMASRIIVEDAKNHPNFNIASLLDGDTRIYPLRYTIYLDGGNPGGVENYPNNNSLYIVANNENDIKNSKTWEIDIFRPFEISQKWDLEDNIFLYRLDRANH